MVEVLNGVNQLSVEGLDGQTVGEARRRVAQALNVDPAATAMVNGETVTASHVLVDGDELEFCKASGVKGY